MNSRKTKDNLGKESQSEGNKILISPKAEPPKGFIIQKPLKTEKTELAEELTRKIELELMSLKLWSSHWKMKMCS